MKKTELKNLCELWDNNALDNFLECCKITRGDLVCYPTIEFAEKIKRNFASALRANQKINTLLEDSRKINEILK